VIEVSRAGAGPSPEELGSMFDGPATRGSKIGLYLARRVAEAAGGSLSSESDAGIRFHLGLPG
jgi:sensor histidine kinase regulating citrate/malate metabolism